jgi:hypothetical protein
MWTWERYASARFSFTLIRKTHLPMHVHAFTASGECVIDLLEGGNVRLSSRKKARKRITESEIRKALKAADAAYDLLVALWKEAH